MRDPNRIEPFMKELTDIWKTECPDWRFSQFIINVFDETGGNMWFVEEDRMLEHFRNYFDIKGKKKK